MAHAEQQLKQQQQVHETIRAERNATAKQLLDLRDDIAGMRRKFKAMVRCIKNSFLLGPLLLLGPSSFSSINCVVG